MINYIEINPDCVTSINDSTPVNIIAEHFIRFYSLNGNIIPLLEIELETKKAELITKKGFYLKVANLLGRKKIRAVVKKDFQKILELFPECIICSDISNELNAEDERTTNKVYQLIYFGNKLLLEDYVNVMEAFNSFFKNNNIEPISISINVSDNSFLAEFFMITLSNHSAGNNLLKLLISLNKTYKIISLNGYDFEKSYL